MVKDKMKDKQKLIDKEAIEMDEVRAEVIKKDTKFNHNQGKS